MCGMKVPISALFVLTLFLFTGTASAVDSAATETKCPPDTDKVPDSSGICADPEALSPLVSGQGVQMLQPVAEPGPNPLLKKEKRADRRRVPKKGEQKTVVVYFFWGRGCPHCEKEKGFLSELQRANPSLNVRDYEVWYDKKNAALLSSLLTARGMRSSGVPITFVDQEVFAGFSRQSQAGIAGLIEACRTRTCIDPADVLMRDAGKGATALTGPGSQTKNPKGDAGEFVDLPLAGSLDARTTSLPVLTIMIAGVDSFNPCAFFVLLTLLGLLVHAQSRNKMLLVGGVFVFFSGLIYFLFMAAWLNLFLVMGNVAIITMIAGLVSILIAAINIKDFFLFKQGVSLLIPDSAKPKLFDRMRRLLRSPSLFSILIGATVLAVVANSYELLCTAGFPMVYTRILTLHALSPSTYYLYLVFYNIVYVVPLFLIVFVFTITLGNKKLSEWQGRFLKLISGIMMLGLGGVLLVNPALLNSLVVSFALLAGALGVSVVLAMVTRKLGY